MHRGQREVKTASISELKGANAAINDRRSGSRLLISEIIWTKKSGARCDCRLNASCEWVREGRGGR